MQTFIVEDQKFEINVKLIPKDSFFNSVCKSEWTIDREVKLDMPLSEFVPIYKYLTTGNTDVDGLSALIDALNIKNNIHEYPDEYWCIKLEEDYYREHKNKEYKLIDSDEIADNFNYGSDFIYTNNILKSRVIQYNTYAHCNMNIKKVKRYLRGEFINLDKYEGVVIAGGSIISLLFGQNVNDYDIFMYGLTDEKVDGLVRQIFGYNKCHITDNSITYYKNQLILRMYNSIEEILTGFDLDASGICYVPYTNKIYLTRRCLHALKTMTNYVDFDRLSTTYEYRLVKYAKKGFNIWVPSFDKNKIDHEAIYDAIYSHHFHCIINKNDEFLVYKCDKPSRILENKHYSRHTKENIVKRMRGIDILLYIYIITSSGKYLPYIKSEYERGKFKYGKVNCADILKSMTRIDPGKQINGSFHQIVMKNNREWYKGEFVKP